VMMQTESTAAPDVSKVIAASNASDQSTGQKAPEAGADVEMPNASAKLPIPSETSVAEPATASEHLESFLLQGQESVAASANTAPQGDQAWMEEPLSQDWSGITPTAMWTSREDSFDKLEISATAPFVPEQANEQPLDISATMPFIPNDQPADISPTAPFAPENMQSREISPTMPFIPKEDAAQNFDISPTMAFVPRDATAVPAAISQTQPFFPDDSLAVSQTQPFVASSVPQKSLVGVSPSAASGPSAEQVKSAARPLMRSTSRVSEESLSGSQSSDGALGEDEDTRVRQNPGQLKREREWLRHNRQAARRDAKESIQRLKRRKVSVEDHSSTLSSQERSRYAEFVETNVVVAKTVDGTSDAARLMRGADVSEEAEVFGKKTFGIAKKKSFFMR